MWRGLLLVALACFGLSSVVQAVSPPPDGGYPNGNTAEGDSALFSLTSGSQNTANGFQALFSNTTGNSNTANGVGALYSNTTGLANTANGTVALECNTTGGGNTATGQGALLNNTTGTFNTATGFAALARNITGNDNTATGVYAFYRNTTGGGNTATGFAALENNTTGENNTAHGAYALSRNTIGSKNIPLGGFSGDNLSGGSNNIDIGNEGVAGDGNTIRIGSGQTATYIAGISGATVAGGVAVIVDANGHLGTVVSSQRFKDEIKPMDKASEAILALKPVTFHYKKEIDPDGVPQFGLEAEQVEKINPDLVARDAKGEVYTVRYEAVNAMLLNEFLKEHRIVQELKSIVAKQEATAAQQQKEIKALTANLKRQASQIQNVSAQLELSKSAPQMVLNNQ